MVRGARSSMSLIHSSRSSKKTTVSPSPLSTTLLWLEMLCRYCLRSFLFLWFSQFILFPWLAFHVFLELFPSCLFVYLLPPKYVVKILRITYTMLGASHTVEFVEGSVITLGRVLSLQIIVCIWWVILLFLLLSPNMLCIFAVRLQKQLLASNPLWALLYMRNSCRWDLCFVSSLCPLAIWPCLISLLLVSWSVSCFHISKNSFLSSFSVSRRFWALLCFTIALPSLYVFSRGLSFAADSRTMNYVVA